MSEIVIVDIDTAVTDTAYTVTLEGVSYTIRLQYIQRLTNESSSDGSTIADEFSCQIKLSGDSDYTIMTCAKTNRDILAPYHYKDACPAGSLYIRDWTADKNLISGGKYSPERITYDDLGTRFLMYYIPSDYEA